MPPRKQKNKRGNAANRKKATSTQPKPVQPERVGASEAVAPANDATVSETAEPSEPSEPSEPASEVNTPVPEPASEPVSEVNTRQTTPEPAVPAQDLELSADDIELLDEGIAPSDDELELPDDDIEFVVEDVHHSAQIVHRREVSLQSRPAVRLLSNSELGSPEEEAQCSERQELKILTLSPDAGRLDVREKTEISQREPEGTAEPPLEAKTGSPVGSMSEGLPEAILETPAETLADLPHSVNDGPGIDFSEEKEQPTEQITSQLEQAFISEGPGNKQEETKTTHRADEPLSMIPEPVRPELARAEPCGNAGAPAEGSPRIIGAGVVGFHHTRGPEIEYWTGLDGVDPKIWPLIPFQSLPDGSHAFEQTVCYFTLLYDPVTKKSLSPTPERDSEGHILDPEVHYDRVETLIAIACMCQRDSDSIASRGPEITRSTVQKSVFVIARQPLFGALREKVSIVSRSYMAQDDLRDFQILDQLFENLSSMSLHLTLESDNFLGISSRKEIVKFGQGVLVLLKAILLEKKILVYSADTDSLCHIQFTLLSLIPGLIAALRDSGSPMLSTYETERDDQTHLRLADRKDVFRLMGLPLNVFAAGGYFNPFVPLQLFEHLRSPETRYGLFGSTNRLITTSKIEHDILVDVETGKITIYDKQLQKALELSQADKHFFDKVATAIKANNVDSTWGEDSLTYAGSEEFVRQKFEDYFLGLVSSAKYETRASNDVTYAVELKAEYPSDPLSSFNPQWAALWRKTNNYRIFQSKTGEEIYHLTPPIHVGKVDEKQSFLSIFTKTEPATPKAESQSKSFGLWKWATAKQKPASTSQPSTPVLQQGHSYSEQSSLTSSPEPSKEPEGDKRQPSSLLFWRS